MIQSIKIGNFKAFGETQEIPVKPLTLLFGQNSVGKSSLLHALLFIEEFASTKSIDIHKITKNNQTVDLGGPKQFVHSGENEITIGGRFSSEESFTSGEVRAFLKYFCDLDPNNYVGGESIFIKSIFEWKIVICFGNNGENMLKSFELNNPQSILKVPPKENSNPSNLITEEVEWVSLESEKPSKGEIEYQLVDIEFEGEKSEIFVIKRDSDDNNLKLIKRKKFHPGSYCLLSDKYINDNQFIKEIVDNSLTIDLEKDEKELEKVSDVTFQIDANNFEIKNTDYGDTFGLSKLTLKFDIDRYFNTFFEKLGKEFGKLIYEPPVRAILNRDTFSSEEYFGPYWEEILNNDAYLKLINEFLTHTTLLDLDYKLALEKYSSNLQEKYLKTLVLKNLENGKILSFKDVGTGLSQLIPLVSAVAVMNESIILMEQPELHLHPGLQSRFGKILSRVPKGSNRAIVETHSEHLIKAIQLEIARYRSTNGEDGLNKDEVEILYFTQENGETKIREIKLDDVGNFKEPWPDDFFDSSADLTMERLKFMQRNKN